MLPLLRFHLQKKQARVLACLFFFLFSTPRQPAPAQDYEVSVTTVTVWVRALDSAGRNVEGLTMSDFEIFEDGRKRDISCFERLDTQNPAEPQAGAAIAGAPERLLIFFDLTTISPSEYERIKPSLQDFLIRMKGGNWETTVSAYTPEGRILIAGPFQGKPSNLVQSLDKMPANERRDVRIRQRDRELNMLLGGALEQRGSRSGDESADSLRGETASLQLSYLAQAGALARKYAAEDEESSRLSVWAVETVAEQMQQKGSRQHLTFLFVSGGFNIDPGRIYFDRIRRTSEKLTGSADIDVGGLPSKEAHFVQKQVKECIEKLSRGNITLYSINTRGPLTGFPDAGVTDPVLADRVDDMRDYQDGMARMASETGGVSWENSNDFEKGFDRILQDLSTYYVLCYMPPEHSANSKSHRIKVKLKKPGIHLRYRETYVD